MDALLAGRDALGIMPTGGGKSLCYQVPALLLPGVTLVISPLISLMKGQVMALEKAGVPAAFLNSSLSAAERRAVYDGLRQGAYRLLYVAPERLEAENFSALARELTIPLAAVDEAHCVSQWGQDFRPSYRRIAGFLASLPRRPAVGAFTATATDLVRRDIVELLGLRDPVRVVTGFDRPNLFFDARQPRNKGVTVLELLRQREGRSGIVYCATRAAVERLCEALREHGIPATRYHAGLSEEERRQNQEDFQFDRCPVMVATNAFGMGGTGRGRSASSSTPPPTWPPPASSSKTAAAGTCRRRRRRRSGGRTTGGSRPSPPTAGAPGASGASCWTTSARSTASAAGTAATAWGTSAGRTSPGRRR